MDGVVFFRGRVVVPQVLRRDVLDGLQWVHQGTTGISLRAQDSVWWPGFTKNLERVREACMSCRKNAPSQPSMPPV